MATVFRVVQRALLRAAFLLVAFQVRLCIGRPSIVACVGAMVMVLGVVILVVAVLGRVL